VEYYFMETVVAMVALAAVLAEGQIIQMRDQVAVAQAATLAMAAEEQMVQLLAQPGRGQIILQDPVEEVQADLPDRLSMGNLDIQDQPQAAALGFTVRGQAV
jgi:hypothetical protein